MREICSKLKIKTPEQRHQRRSGVFIVNFDQISHITLVFLLLALTKYMPAGSSRAHLQICIHPLSFFVSVYFKQLFFNKTYGIVL